MGGEGGRPIIYGNGTLVYTWERTPELFGLKFCWSGVFSTHNVEFIPVLCGEKPVSDAQPGVVRNWTLIR